MLYRGKKSSLFKDYLVEKRIEANLIVVYSGVKQLLIYDTYPQGMVEKKRSDFYSLWECR